MMISWFEIKFLLVFFLCTGINPNFNPLVLKKPPPRTPDKCDPELSFDAVSELQQEILFFKDRFVNLPDLASLLKTSMFVFSQS